MAQSTTHHHSSERNASGPTACTAFEGSRRFASGDLPQVALKAKAAIDRGGALPVLIFDDSSGAVVDVDFRGTADDVAKRLAVMVGPADNRAGADEVRRGPGRPKLGVVAREVTLLPRHWDWLNDRPGGASVALRKLVEEARRTSAGPDRVRHAQEGAYRFMSAMAGNEPGFEEATRALFACNRERFDECVAPWPADVRDYAGKMAAVVFAPAET